ncbi:unnamed protein product [Gadus morhua 'NCC']
MSIQPHIVVGGRRCGPAVEPGSIGVRTRWWRRRADGGEPTEPCWTTADGAMVDDSRRSHGGREPTEKPWWTRADGAMVDESRRRSHGGREPTAPWWTRADGGAVGGGPALKPWWTRADGAMVDESRRSHGGGEPTEPWWTRADGAMVDESRRRHGGREPTAPWWTRADGAMVDESRRRHGGREPTEEPWWRRSCLKNDLGTRWPWLMEELHLEDDHESTCQQVVLVCTDQDSVMEGWCWSRAEDPLVKDVPRGGGKDSRP